MAGAPLIINVPIERPNESSGSHFTEPWLEPFLVKHSSWYRRHLTTAGRRESKSSKRPSRNSSVVTTTSYTTEAAPKKNRASVDEDEQWQQVEEEFKETASAHERDRRVLEV